MIFVCAFWFAATWLVKNHFVLNQDYTARQFFSSVWYVFKSVMFEELIFRGALLFILIKRTGVRTALAISAVAFGIYHWFSFGIFGQPLNMIFVFISTGIVGFVLALAFQKTRSLYVPIALHFGYNFTSMIIFSSDKSIVQQLLVKAYEKDPASAGAFLSVVVAVVYFLGFPVLTYLYLRSINHKVTK